MIISRNYRGDVDMNVIDKFIPMLIDMEEEGQQLPIIDHPEATFIFIKYNNIYGGKLHTMRFRIVLMWKRFMKFMTSWCIH